MEKAMENTPALPNYNVVLLGTIAAGKSATGNTILKKRNAFISKKSMNAVTQQVQSETVNRNDVKITVYDTPGLFDPKANLLSDEENIKRHKLLFDFDTAEPLVYLLVMRTDRFTAEEKKTVESIEDFLPDYLLKNTWIIFTRGDELERDDVTIETLIEESEDLKAVVQRFENRYFVFNNITQDPEEVDKLIDQIKQVKPERRTRTETLLERKVSPDCANGEIRLILLGKTGVGKSSTGNTLLGNDPFQSKRSFNSVTKQCKLGESVVDGKNISVVDTPGFFDPTVKPKQASREIAKSYKYCSPGPHAFLYVVSLSDRFLQADTTVIDYIKKMYGEEVTKYTIPVFTHCDQLEGESVEELIRQNEVLSSFIQRCGGIYHIINNNDTENKKQVKSLLEKIKNMIKKNEGSYYSNALFRDGLLLTFEEFFKKHESFFTYTGLFIALVAIMVPLVYLGILEKDLCLSIMVSLFRLFDVPTHFPSQKYSILSP